jgi:tRNA uridine 5-carboxymethylaminomethyl modification enzyme
MEKGYDFGLINDEQFGAFLRKKAEVEIELERIKTTRLKPGEINPVLTELGSNPIKEDALIYKLLKRPEVKYADIVKISPPENELPGEVISQVEIQTKYKGYIRRQAELAEKFKKIEKRSIPEGFVYKGISGLSREMVEKLEEVRPLNLGQAGRIPGVTPAAVSILMIVVEKERRSYS